MMFRILFFALLAAGIAACSSEQNPSTPAESATQAATGLEPAKGIEWYEGSVEDAFASAKESGRPVFLYWGAVWCPPCHAISATIFKSPEFIERSKLFVAVYLDGDTENAQEYGEKFGVVGYPTMIVFNSSGAELTRIPGGIDLQAYANILDLTLQQSSSVTDVVADLAGGATTLSTGDCTLLAYYSWGQDGGILADVDAAKAFRGMYEACSVEQSIERSILYFSWLDEVVAAANAEEDAVALSAEQKAEAMLAIDAMLTDDKVLRANISTALHAGDDYVAALTESQTDARSALIERFVASYNRIAADESVYKRERIYTLLGKIGMQRIDDDEAELSAELKDEIRAMVTWADETTPDVYERQPIINALGNVLNSAGMDEDARPLLLAELDKSKQPYYYMVELADIEQRAGNTDAAIGWLKQAHEATQGPATRFQWGYYYLVGLLEMTPENTQLIHDTAVGLIEELQNSGGLYHRPKAQLVRMQSKLVSWSEDNGQAEALTEIRESVLQVCASAKRQDASRATCDAFLEAV